MIALSRTSLLPERPSTVGLRTDSGMQYLRKEEREKERNKERKKERKEKMQGVRSMHLSTTAYLHRYTRHITTPHCISHSRTHKPTPHI